MKHVLATLAHGGEIGWLSFYFAEFIARQTRTDMDELPALSAALVSEHNQAGDVCIDLADFSGRRLFDSSRIDSADIPLGIDAADWARQLVASGAVGSRDHPAPLLLEESRLYLYRYWYYEDSVTRWLLDEAGGGNEDPVSANLFPDQKRQLDPDQRAAVIAAASRRFCVISGGPGSGKTSTVVQILNLLLARDPECRIALAAPTGKASARMMESIRANVEKLGQADRLRSALPTAAGTLRRLLEYRGREFGYHARRRLPCDCVIVDEASMIDLNLMHHLLAALPDHARLILLGDRDQLASVAAGNVLGDITGHGQDVADGHSALSESIVLLRRNYRFDRDSAIGELAAAVNLGRSDDALQLLRQQRRGLRWHRPREDRLDDALLEDILDEYQRIFDSRSPADALEAFAAIRVLAATNRGATGVDSLNQAISRAIRERNAVPESGIYHGLPVMVTRNHHQLRLYNGDTGILWQFDHGLRACFDDGERGLRDFAINRLPEFVPAWASTVHKSQGSEFDTVILALPQDPQSTVLSRELVYTAITRARRRFVLHAAEPVFVAATGRLTRRHSGLAAKLGWREAGDRDGPAPA